MPSACGLSRLIGPALVAMITNLQFCVDFPHDPWRRHHQTALAELQELVARGEAAARTS